MIKPRQRNPVEWLGAYTIAGFRYLGGMSILLGLAMACMLRGVTSKKHRFSFAELSTQLVRVGVKSLGIVCLVQAFIGVILALQLAPPLAEFQQQSQIPSIIGIGGFRMLGPILTAVVLSGFAGASIAAEIGTMVVAEEVEAMQAMALNPVRFLVVPRVLATLLAMLLLTPIADWMIALGGLGISKLVLGPEVYQGYWDTMRNMLEYSDFYTGMIQAAVFGVLIGLIACYEGLKVRGGAAGVGQATTLTVVYSIVAIIIAACIFTMIFYVWEN